MNILKELKEKGNLKTLLLHSSWALTLTSGISYAIGMLRDRIFVQTFGFSRVLDIYNASFVIPDMIMSILIGAALSAAFIPIFTKQYDQKQSLGYKYTNQIISWGVLIVVIVAIIAGITLPYFTKQLVPGFNPEEVTQYILLTRIMLTSAILFAISNSYGRVLIGVKEFFWWGLSPALYNLGIIIGVIFLVPKFGIKGLVFGTIFGAGLHLINRLIALKQKKYNFKSKIDFNFSPEIKETIKLTIPKIFQYGMFHFLLISFTAIATSLPKGSVTAYNYARNFQSLPVSLLGIAIATAMFPTLSHYAGKGNFKKFRSEFKKNRVKSIFYTTLSAIALALSGRILITILLGGGNFGEAEINLLSKLLIVYCFTVPLESLAHIYHRSFYSLKNIIVPATVHTIVIIGTIILAKTLAPIIGIYAIPVSFGSGLLIQVSTLAIIFPFVLRKKELNSLIASSKQ